VLPSGDGHRAALSFVVRDGRITRIDAIRNPEKLRRLQAKRRSITRTAFPARMPSRGRALSKEAPYAMGSIG